MKNFELKAYLQQKRQIVDQGLDKFLDSEQTWPETLHRSMRYSLLAGGKRLRPILTLAACECIGGNETEALPTACALEMIHTYSLIHDDLPAMDNDDLRRGRPTNHKVFGEAVAILAGDALLTEAFRIVAHYSVPEKAAVILKVVDKLGQACGSKGMVGGQVHDLESEGKKISREELEKLHRHKTGKLIQVSVEVGALLGQASTEELQALSSYGEKIGLAFQIADDILDIEGGEEIGKDLKSDLEKNKATYPSILGLETSKQLAAQITAEALEALRIFGERGTPLRAIAEYVVKRSN